MQTLGPSTTPTDYWYQKPGAIEHWFYGVFEGGGAKGVAYTGALLAMEDNRCWFQGVAGASAGAITAAMIAAGLSPEEMQETINDSLASVKTGVWGGIRRLSNATGFFSSSDLHS